MVALSRVPAPLRSVAFVQASGLALGLDRARLQHLNHLALGLESILASLQPHSPLAAQRPPLRLPLNTMDGGPLQGARSASVGRLRAGQWPCTWPRPCAVAAPQPPRPGTRIDSSLTPASLPLSGAAASSEAPPQYHGWWPSPGCPLRFGRSPSCRPVGLAPGLDRAQLRRLSHFVHRPWGHEPLGAQYIRRLAPSGCARGGFVFMRVGGFPSNGSDSTGRKIPGSRQGARGHSGSSRGWRCAHMSSTGARQGKLPWPPSPACHIRTFTKYLLLVQLHLQFRDLPRKANPQARSHLCHHAYHLRWALRQR
jgi:hypothetical protein